MALKPSVFPKSDFEITEGAYKITNPHFAIPNPAAFIKDDDPNREEKLARFTVRKEYFMLYAPALMGMQWGI